MTFDLITSIALSLFCRRLDYMGGESNQYDTLQMEEYDTVGSRLASEFRPLVCSVPYESLVHCTKTVGDCGATWHST